MWSKKPEKEKEQQAQLAILKQIKRQKFGATYALQKIARLTGVYQDLKAVFGQSTQDILNVAYYLILNPTNSLKQLPAWQEDQFQPTGSKSLSSQRLSELLKVVTEAHKQSFFQRQADRQPKDAVWFYDTTSISSYSQLLTQVKYGFNKEHDSLPQINLAMVFNETTGLPIMYRQLNGNIPYHQTIPWLLALFDDLPTQDIHLALDRGFYSKQTIQYLLQKGLSFIMGGKSSVKYIQNAIDQVSDWIESPVHYSKNYKLYMTQVKTDQFKASETSHYPVTLHIYYDIEKAADERKCLDENLLARFERLKSGKQEKGDMTFNKKFFRKEERDGETICSLNEPAIFQHKRRLGYFVLLSNTEMTTRKVLEHYRNKDMIEKAFHDLKNRLNLRRVRVKSDRTLEGKLFVQYIALLFLI